MEFFRLFCRDRRAAILYLNESDVKNELVTYATPFGTTALHIVAEDGDLESASLLIRYGASPTASRNPNCCKPIELAIVCDHIEMVRLFMPTPILAKYIAYAKTRRMIDFLLSELHPQEGIQYTGEMMISTSSPMEYKHISCKRCVLCSCIDIAIERRDSYLLSQSILLHNSQVHNSQVQQTPKVPKEGPRFRHMLEQMSAGIGITLPDGMREMIAMNGDLIEGLVNQVVSNIDDTSHSVKCEKGDRRLTHLLVALVGNLCASSNESSRDLCDCILTLLNNGANPFGSVAYMTNGNRYTTTAIDILSSPQTKIEDSHLVEVLRWIYNDRQSRMTLLSHTGQSIMLKAFRSGRCHTFKFILQSGCNIGNKSMHKMPAIYDILRGLLSIYVHPNIDDKVVCMLDLLVYFGVMNIYERNGVHTLNSPYAFVKTLQDRFDPYHTHFRDPNQMTPRQSQLLHILTSFNHRAKLSKMALYSLQSPHK